MTFETLFFATRLAPPRIGGRIVRRGALLERLRSLQQRRLILVTGSAGFGKTILLAQHRQELLEAGHDVAWLSLSAEDRGLTAFRAYLMAAAHDLGLSLHPEESLVDESEAANEGVIRALINEARLAPRELYLCIDDFHHVEDPRAHQLVQMLLDAAPDNVHLVIAARAVPPLRLSRLRVMGQLGEIECTDLPFDARESLAFLERNVTRRLTFDEARLVHDLTEGWPASLQLAAIALNGRGSQAMDLRKLVLQVRDLRTYLAENVLTQLSPELVEFMEPLALFRRFCAPLARDLTDRTDAAEVIESIERANLFLFPVELEDTEPWFRFHPLFAEVLAERLVKRSAESVTRIHERACRWFAERDLLAEALHHGRLSGRPQGAIELVERVALEQTRLSHLGPLARWIEDIPADLQAPHPMLPVLGALAHALTGRITNAQQILERIPQAALATNPALAARAQLVRATLATQRDETAELLETVAGIPEELLPERMMRQTRLTALLLGLVARGLYEQARHTFDAHPIAHEERRDEMMLIAESVLLVASWHAGDCHATIQFGEELLARAETLHGRRSISACMSAALLAAARYETGCTDVARDLLANRMDMLRRSTPETAIQAALCAARIDAAQGDRERAHEFLKDQQAHFTSAGFARAAAAMLALRIELNLQAGSLAAAIAQRDALARSLGTHAAAATCDNEVTAILARADAHLALASGHPRQALDSLARARAWLERFRRGAGLVDCDLLCVRIHHALGDRAAARTAMHRALQAGARLGLVRTFLDHGTAIADELERLLAADELSSAGAEHARRILGTAAPHDERPTRSNAASPVPVSAFTPRELEVMRMLDQAMSTKRIALTLNISPNTVKWNVKNIFGKLGVNSRYAALARARHLNLLQGGPDSQARRQGEGGA